MLVIALLVAFVALLVAAMAILYARRTAARTGRVTRYRRRRLRQRTAPLFRLDRLSQHRYVLRNDGALTAHDVRLETGDLTVTEGETEMREFGPGHTEEYLLIQPMHGRVSELTVTWRLSPGDDLAQVTRLPLDSEPASEGQDA